MERKRPNCHVFVENMVIHTENSIASKSSHFNLKRVSRFMSKRDYIQKPMAYSFFNYAPLFFLLRSVLIPWPQTTCGCLLRIDHGITTFHIQFHFLTAPRYLDLNFSQTTQNQCVSFLKLPFLHAFTYCVHVLFHFLLEQLPNRLVGTGLVPQQFQGMVQRHPRVSETIPRGPRGQNYVHSHTKMLPSVFPVLTFALMLRGKKQWW